MLAAWLTLLIITHPPHFILFARIARWPLQYDATKGTWGLVGAVTLALVLPGIIWAVTAVGIMKLICTLFTAP